MCKAGNFNCKSCMRKHIHLVFKLWTSCLQTMIFIDLISSRLTPIQKKGLVRRLTKARSYVHVRLHLNWREEVFEDSKRSFQVILKVQNGQEEFTIKLDYSIISPTVLYLNVLCVTYPKQIHGAPRNTAIGQSARDSNLIYADWCTRWVLPSGTCTYEFRKPSDGVDDYMDSFTLEHQSYQTKESFLQGLSDHSSSREKSYGNFCSCIDLIEENLKSPYKWCLKWTSKATEFFMQTTYCTLPLSRSDSHENEVERFSPSEPIPSTNNPSLLGEAAFTLNIIADSADDSFAMSLVETHYFDIHEDQLPVHVVSSDIATFGQQQEESFDCVHVVSLAVATSEHQQEESVDCAHATSGQTEEQSIEDLRRRHQELVDQTLCKICNNNKMDTVLQPCCHITCFECFQRCFPNCPFCRSQIVRPLRVHMF